MTIVVTAVPAHQWIEWTLYADGGDRLAVD